MSCLPMPVPLQTWPPDLVERVKAQWLAGASGGVISAALAAKGIHRSSSAIIGRMYREGLSFRGTGLSHAGLGRKSQQGRRKAARQEKSIVVKAPPAPRPAPRPRACDVAIPPPLRVDIVDARDGQCRWIAGDPRRDATCCGHPVDAASPAYCAAHRIIGTAPRARADAYATVQRAA